MREFETAGGPVTLIDSLTETLRPVRRRRPWRDALILAAILALQLAGTMALLGDTAAAVFTRDMAGTAAKAAMLAGLTAGFAALAFRSFDPAAPAQKGLAMGIAAILLGFGVVMLDRSFGGSAMEILMPMNGLVCLVSSISFSLPMFIALSVFMRGGAPTRPRLTALFVGVAAGSWGVFVYGLQCPFTNIAYLAVWYGGAVALVTAAAAALLPRIARW